jgi:cob(I)alamin adenosyltransferase
MVKIYTKTGDRGETSLFNGSRVIKSDAYICALGAIDETNSSLGVVLAMMPREECYGELRQELEIIQHALFDVGAAVATPLRHASSNKLAKTRFDSKASVQLEQWIDKHQAALPPLKEFILPGGHPAGAMLHLARTICRRAESAVVPLYQQQDIDEAVLIYLNRLSDYLFVLARRMNTLSQCTETIWQHHLSATAT